MLTDIFSGAANRRLDSVEAFETPPLNPHAKRWATIALMLFCATSMLFLAAALVDWFTGNRFVSEILGWSGIVAFQLCVVCGIRYAAVNKPLGRDVR
jgi:hypothetical protein